MCLCFTCAASIKFQGPSSDTSRDAFSPETLGMDSEAWPASYQQPHSTSIPSWEWKPTSSKGLQTRAETPKPLTGQSRWLVFIFGHLCGGHIGRRKRLSPLSRK